MNNKARKANIYLHCIPDFGFVKHRNDRWRLVMRLRKTRRLYLVSVAIGGVLCRFYEYALNEESIYSQYDHLSTTKVEEVKK